MFVRGALRGETSRVFRLARIKKTMIGEFDNFHYPSRGQSATRDMVEGSVARSITAGP